MQLRHGRSVDQETRKLNVTTLRCNIDEDICDIVIIFSLRTDPCFCQRTTNISILHSHQHQGWTDKNYMLTINSSEEDTV